MIALPPDPWKILGVEKTADKSEIRSAYKKLVLKCHPDKVQDPTLKAEKQEEFQKVQQAYELLNNDAERTKYEEQVQLMELRRQAALLSKNMPNTSSPRTSSKSYSYEIRTAEIRTAEPKHKSSSGSGKVYEHYSSPHTRSHEEVSARVYIYDETEKHAKRRASYEKPSRRDEERRERESRRRRDEEDRILREREREREREIREREREKERKAEKKKQRELEEKQRDKERRRERKSPYVEDYGSIEEEVYTTSRLDKKRSSSRKHSEYREREKSMSRRDRDPSPAIEVIEPTKTKDQALKETAADYIARSRGGVPASSPIFQRSQTQEPFYQPPVPTPPPVEFEEESIRRSSARAAGRRASHDGPKERSLHKQSSRDAYIVEATPSKSRPVPSLSKSHSTPPIVPESPPRMMSRSHTVPLQEYARPIPQPPSFSRTATWGGGEDVRADYYAEYDESDDDHRRHRRSRRTRSPDAVSYRYEVLDRPKSSKHDPYSYGESPSSRRYPPEVVEASGVYSIPFRVKESKHYGPEDVTFSPYYSYKVSGDQFPTQVPA